MAAQPVARATAGKPAAVVNGEPISMGDLEVMLKMMPTAVEVPEETRRRHATAMP